MPMTRERLPCPVCEEPLPAKARFCPSCGSRTDIEGETKAEELPPTEADVPVNVVAVEPRWFGMTPPVASFGLGTASLALGILFLALGRWVLGSLLVVVGVVFLAFFLESARRRPATPAARVSARIAADITGGARLAVGSLGAWSRAGREVIRLRRELRTLKNERGRTQFELGGAAYRENEAEVATLRARLADIDSQIAARAEAIGAAVEGARWRVKRELVAARPTERIEAPDPEKAETAAEPARDVKA
jgi:hypothetical protein